MGPILSPARLSGAVLKLWRYQSVVRSPRGLQSWLCQSIAAPRNSRLQALLKGRAGTRGFNCTLGILFSASPGIIYKNRKQKKQGERKNIKGLLNFHAAFEQAAFWIGSQPGASGKRAGAGSRAPAAPQ